jgi:hypothetical protein
MLRLPHPRYYSGSMQRFYKRNCTSEHPSANKPKPQLTLGFSTKTDYLETEPLGVGMIGESNINIWTAILNVVFSVASLF